MEPSTPAETSVVSFVLRFVYETPAEWHGVIRHVQSNTEFHFTQWGEAQKFMAQYVEVKIDEGRKTQDGS